MLGASGWQMFWRVTLPNVEVGPALRRRSCATRARWASSARCRSSPATSAGRPTRCRCTSRCSTTSTTSRPRSRWPRCSSLLALRDAGREARPREWRTRGGARAPTRRGSHEHPVTQRHQALRQLSPRCATSSLDVAGGELVALLGPSGSGKTTLLRLIAGLEAPDAGSSLLDGDDVDAAARARAQRRLRVPALRAVPPHDGRSRTSRSACACARRPHARRSTRARRRAARARAARGSRRALSRRSSPVASASASRSRARSPPSRSVLLLDEPFGALDARCAELRQLAAPAARRDPRDDRLRHPRSGGGLRGRRPRRGHEPGPRRAGGHAAARSSTSRRRRS